MAKKIYDEIIGSIQETDDDIRFRWGERYEYFVRTVKGKAYPIVCRVPVKSEGTKAVADKEEVVLDMNEVAKTLKYCSLGSFRLSPSHDVLAYSIDPNGYETYEVRFKDLKTGVHLPDVIKGTAGGVSWGAGDAEVYYSTQDDAHRSDKVWRHAMGTPQSSDVCVLKEDDELFSVGFGRTSSGKYMLLETESTETNEVRVVPLSQPKGEPLLMQPRRLGHRYYPEHRGEHWYILTNRNERINFDLVVAPVNAPEEANWVPIVTASGASGAFAWSEGRTLESIAAFENFLVLEGREGGFSALWVLQLHESTAAITSWHKTSWPSENCCVYTAVASSSLGCVGANQEFCAEEIFVTYMSLTTPKTVYRYNMRTQDKTVIKVTPVNGFNAEKVGLTMNLLFPYFMGISVSLN